MGFVNDGLDSCTFPFSTISLSVGLSLFAYTLDLVFLTEARVVMVVVIFKAAWESLPALSALLAEQLDARNVNRGPCAQAPLKAVIDL